ncbi:hypothetical protein PsYK624_106440 [Phanerochaete sordida]|uniref:Uncharacterized protein n=1 Tax=Phanerochaete sordida TaxID=48140 RepID=A0A9P3GJ17_9APHY|nr:hypothetical protein PsYK624_106440 [Phanerochaete sordida]
MSSSAASASASATQRLFLGHVSKTPTISGLVSGGAVALAWFIGFIIYFYKRHRREKRARALGFRSHREMLDPPKKKEAFIIPPDPAIVEAGLHPGQRIYNDPKVRGDDFPKHAHTIPMSVLKHTHDEMVEDTSETPRPEMKHSSSEPTWYGDQTPASSSKMGHWPGSSQRSISSEMTIPKH